MYTDLSNLWLSIFQKQAVAWNWREEHANTNRKHVHEMEKKNNIKIEFK